VGTFNRALQIGERSGQRWEWLEALVDTGATHTMVPGSVLRGLGLAPTRRFPFVLADGRRVELEMTEAPVRYGDVGVTTLIVFGEEGTGALLGAYTLEGLGLAVDTVNLRPVPMTGLLMSVGQNGRWSRLRPPAIV
jgi:clan AA aspartic protease